MNERSCRSCRGVLSRYNPAALCATCAQQRTASRPPKWLWDSEPLRRALADVDLGVALAIIRTAAGLSQLQLAALLGWSQSGVARVESGQRDTLYDIRRLVEVADALDMPRAALIPLLVGVSDGEGTEREETDDMAMNRRELGGAVLVGLATAASLGGDMQVPARVDAAHVRYLQASVERLIANDQHIGGGALRGDGLRLYQRARRMLDEADYTESTGRQLMRAVGELAVCAGWLCFDSNDYPTARALYTEARLLADQSGDHDLTVHALANTSLELVRAAQADGRPADAREAIRLTQRADDLTRTAALPPLHALLAARQATAYAALGDRSGFTHAIARAWLGMDREPGAEVPAWLRFVNRSEIATHEARGYSYLGDHGSAVELYRTSLDSQLMPRNSTIYRASLSSVLAASGDVAGAVVEGTTVLGALDDGQITSPRTLDRLRGVRDAAARHRSGGDFCACYDRAMGVSA